LDLSGPGVFACIADLEDRVGGVRWIALVIRVAAGSEAFDHEHDSIGAAVASSCDLLYPPVSRTA
jgi:hypothetical protein